MSLLTFLVIVFMFIGDFVSGLRSRSSSQCGVPLPRGKIIGGVDSGGYHYPWFALLLLKKNSFLPVPVCAGSLISSIHILSAAHCFTISASVQYDDLFTVALGVYDICNDGEETRQIFNIADVAIHEKYQKDGKFHDIALIKLDRSANFVSICLPLSGGVPDITEVALIIGFGVTDENSNLTPCHMLEVNVTKYSRKMCSATGLPLEEKKEPSIICAGEPTGAVDSCYGDSGGPLQTLTPDGRYVIAGIVSYGYGCGTPNIPAVYTNVGSYIQWIENKMGVLGFDDSGTKKIQRTFHSPNQNRTGGISRGFNSSVTFPRHPNSTLPSGDQKSRAQFGRKRPTSASLPFWREKNRRDRTRDSKSKVSFPE